MSVTCTHSIMAAGAAPREVSWQVKDEARAGGGGGQPLLLSLCFGNKDFRRTRRHCANCLQHFFVAVAICRLAFINRLDPTPKPPPPTPAYQHLYTAHPPHSAAAMLITATSQSRRKQETLCAVSRQSRVESCEMRVASRHYSLAPLETHPSAAHLYEELNARAAAATGETTEGRGGVAVGLREVACISLPPSSDS